MLGEIGIQLKVLQHRNKKIVEQFVFEKLLFQSREQSRDDFATEKSSWK